jgi:hypothetical protein
MRPGVAMRIFLVFALQIALNSLSAQTITIRVVNGKTGKSLATANVALFNAAPPYYSIGNAKDLRQDGTNVFDLQGVQRIRPGVSGVMSCGKDVVSGEEFATDEIVFHGIAMPNHCGSKPIVAKPGDLVLVYRPPTWWEKYKYK